MKQFKCSMNKKIESLAKKQEAISGKNLMDPEQFEKDIREIIDGEYEKILKGCDDKERQYYELALQLWDDCGYDYAGELYKKLQQQMYDYVSGTDYKMSGNFANIAWDWDHDHKDGIKFADLRKKLLDGVNDADTDEFSTWAIDWFFHAFGTYNMCYNFATDLGEEAAVLEQEDEEERERENSDESKKKRSEKRTVQPPSYDVYTYDELSDEAKEKVKDELLRVRQEYESDVFSDSCGTMLKELFPNSDLKIEYSLSYSQGDGFNTYGSLDVNDLINVDLSAYPFKDSKYITPLSDKTAIKSACEKAEISDIEVPENGRYGYSMADRIELVPSYEVELSDEDVALLNELEKFAQDVMGVFNSQCETDGYDWFYEATDEEVKDWADANDYEFTEDGELA